MKNQSFTHLVLVQAVALTLVACGGGGGGSSGGASTATPAATSPAAPAPPVTPVTQPAVVSTLQTSAAAATYSQGSGELEAFNYLQSVRTSCGFGMLNQNPKLDTASLAHTNFLLQGSSATNGVVGHYESDTNNSFYSGNSPQDRSSAAAYGSSVREILSASVTTLTTADLPRLPSEGASGLNAMRSLVNTVGHLSDAMSGARSLGLGDNSKSFSTTQSGVALTTVQYRFGALLGSQEGSQLLGAGNVASYPCAATQDAEYAFAPATEDPNPFPSITDASVQVGPPILLRADAGATLKIDSYSLKTSTGIDVAVRTDVGTIGTHEFFMVPATRLQPGSTYTVSVKGSANGQAFERTFTFKTKS